MFGTNPSRNGRLVNHDRILEMLENAKITDSQLFSQLLSALVHEEKSIIIGASLFLGRLADERAVPSLLRAFLTTDEEVGAAVAWALGRCGSPVAVPFLATAIRKGFAVSNACEALGHVGNEAVLPVLFDTLHSDYEDVRVCAAKALGNLAQRCDACKRDQIAKSLAPLFQDSSRKVRMSAALILERIRKGP
jgi:HEAT repeat protein